MPDDLKFDITANDSNDLFTIQAFRKRGAYHCETFSLTLGTSEMSELSDKIHEFMQNN